jgi:hypothetical protein
MLVASNSPLGQTGLEAAIAQMRAKLRKSLDERFVEYSLDATNAILHVNSLERSATGDYGKYAGSAQLSYEKVSLYDVAPEPILYTGQYPILFVQFAGWVKQQYGIVLEENEFTISGGPLTELINSSIMSFPPDADSGLMKLRAGVNSARFLAGSEIKFHMAPDNGPVYLKGLMNIYYQGDLKQLAYG